MEENRFSEEQIDDLMGEFIDNWCRIVKCNERWMNAHKYTDAHSRIIMALWYNPEGCTQTFISQKSGISKQQVSSILKEFENKGIVIRKKSDKDERSNNIALTEYGIEVCTDVSTEFRTIFKKAANECAKEDRLEIVKSISILVKAYEKALKESGY